MRIAARPRAIAARLKMEYENGNISSYSRFGCRALEAVGHGAFAPRTVDD